MLAYIKLGAFDVRKGSKYFEGMTTRPAESQNCRDDLVQEAGVSAGVRALEAVATAYAEGDCED